jgi:hypothetical protein
MERAIEEGIAHGIRRAYKHTETPTQLDISAAVETAIWNEISEVIDFGDPDPDDGDPEAEPAWRS